MKIEIWKVAPEGEHLTGAEPAGILELGVARDIKADCPVAYDLHVQVVPGELLATGRLDVRIGFVCARCAEPFDVEIAVPDFVCALPFENKFTSADLTPEIREAILLAFPTHPVCTGTCRGLCVRCGVNLNRTQCKCAPPDDERWGGLSALTFNPGGSHGGSKKKKVKK